MEGTSKRRVELVRAGQLADVVSDLGSADVTGGSTGHAHVAREELPAPVAANLRLEPGTDSTAELIAGIETGVFVERLWYTRVVDATAGTITGTTRDAGWLIRDGRRSTPLRGTRFTESVLDALSRVDGVGRDCLTHSLMNVWNGAVTAPAIRVRGFRLGSPGAAPTGEVGSA
jgi:predicted Zn-dependent protease